MTQEKAMSELTTTYLLTSESVSEGHPDKVADQISDAVLDYVLKHDAFARVACETFIGPGYCVIGGEVSAQDYPRAASTSVTGRRQRRSARYWLQR